MAGLLLDTHAAVWLLEGNAALGARARAEIEKEESLSISGISLLEIALLCQRGKITFRPDTKAGLTALADSFHVLALNAEVAWEAASVALPHKDPFDRVIVATARVFDLTLVTRDEQIACAGVVKTLW